MGGIHFRSKILPEVEKYLRTKINFDVNTLRKGPNPGGLPSLLIKVEMH